MIPTNVKPVTIIFEGLDNTGKTTQIMRLLKYYKDIRVLKSSAISNKQVAKQFYIDKFELIKNNKHEILIFDRFHLGEYVYSPIYRNYDGSYVFDELEQTYKDILNTKESNVYLFIFLDDIDKLIAREDGNSLSKNNKHLIALEYEQFNKCFLKTNIFNKYLININNLTEDDVYSIIIKILQNDI